MTTRILIIEDNLTNLELMCYLLTAFGYLPLTAADGAAGIEMIRRVSPDLVICDIHLPEMDGYQVAQHLKSDPACRDIPIVAVTALAMVGDHDKVLKAGFNGYITKPINPEIFMSQIEVFLRPEQRMHTRPKIEADTIDKPMNRLPKTATLLVVDNTEVNRELLVSTLEPSGYGVILAASVQMSPNTKEFNREHLSIVTNKLASQADELRSTNERLTASEDILLKSDTEIAALGQQARSLAVSVEKSRIETLMESDKAIRKLNEELEQRVLERTRQLEAANKELESFSYSVSHDLRAPLRAIDGFSRIVLDDYAAALPDEVKAYLKLVRDNTRQMGQLVDDLLAFSRLGRLELTKQTVDPGNIVRLCLAAMQTEQQGRQLEILIGDLPSCQADPSLLKQVWTNLISNALKYTRKREAGRIEICCRTELRPAAPERERGGPLNDGKYGDRQDVPSIPAIPGSETVYFIKDNGTGFDMKYAHKLFGVFQRLHRAADYEGTGVGLAIVQRIINRHGGRVWGEAQLNQGATFSFTLA